MTTFKKIRPLVWLVIGGMFLSILSTVIWYQTNEVHDGFAIGKITAINDSSITVADPFEANTNVIITENTRIEDQGQSLLITDLAENIFVQVSGTPTSTATIIADLILVTEPPKKKKR